MEKLIEQLRVILGTNFGLYFKAHSFHWNIEGSNFIQYHTFLGEFYTAVWNNTDLIAEKIRMLDAYAPANMTRIHELADIAETENIPDAMAMFRELSISNERFMFHLRAGIIAADNAGEPAISNFLQDLLDQHAKHNWFFKSIIK